MTITNTPHFCFIAKKKRGRKIGSKNWPIVKTSDKVKQSYLIAEKKNQSVSHNNEPKS